MASRPPSPPPPPSKEALGNWLKALALSPGVLFALAYLSLQLGAALWLNTAFKRDLARMLDGRGDVQLHTGFLSAGPSLDTLTLREVEVRRGSVSTHGPETITLPVGNLGRVAFGGMGAEASRRALCDSILSICRPDSAIQ